MSSVADQVAEKAKEVFMKGAHCSEAIVVAVGDHLWGATPEILFKVACPFGGGIGGCREEACGVITGATIILGALRRRTAPGQDDEPLRATVREFRTRFAATQGGKTLCNPIRDSYPDVDKRCWPVVQEGARILMEMLEK